ncbi:hypothetical protein DF182_02105 [Chitinophaga flava]|uniref:Sugar-binding protein n=1 Tax=Chitinophaga flava TaxID=2259036 RepID=A0A365Y0R9_9BACT|nr:hypothetical protein DF182_02105 [Chitinophaga flava]
MFIQSYSQNAVPQLIPPSPLTQEVEKYINYNVSMYNGLPEISIPLYTIELKGMKIPISLSYHASGIKFQQNSGEVGLGWVLNPSFRVSRTIYGQPDDWYEMPGYVLDSMNYYDLLNEENKVRAPKRDQYLSRFVDKDFTGIPTPANGLNRIDGEYDYFNYSLPTESGAFIIPDRKNKIIKPMELTNTMFNYESGTSQSGILNGFKKFDITDDQGNIYLFGERVAADTNVFESSSKHNGLLANAWAMTKMVTALGDELNFKYIGVDVGMYTGSSLALFEAPFCAAGRVLSGSSRSYATFKHYRSFLIQEIKSNYESVKMTHKDGMTLSKLEIFADDNSLIKAVDFYYSFNGVHNFLDSIKIADSKRSTVEVYKFDYYEKQVYPGDIYIADQWGYYITSVNGLNEFHKEFKSDDIDVVDEPGADRYPTKQTAGYLSGDFSDRTTYNGTRDIFSLKSITYPTGGRVSYRYESNLYQDGFRQRKAGGGLRIQRIESEDLINNSTLVRDYVYGEGESGYGQAILDLDKNYFVNEEVDFMQDPIWLQPDYPRRVLNYSKSIVGDVSATANLSSFVVYPEVAEYEYYSLGKNGKTVYKYELDTFYRAGSFDFPVLKVDECLKRMQYGTDYPKYTNYYKFWNKPLLSEKSSYVWYKDQYGQDQYRRIKVDSFSYRSIFSNIYKGLKVIPFANNGTYHPLKNDLHYYYLLSFFKKGEYIITTGKRYLTQKKETEFDENNRSLSKLTTYEYNDNYRVKSVKTDNGLDIDLEEYTYPTDLSGLNPNNEINRPLLLLKSKNILTPVVEQRKYRLDKSGSNKRLLSAVYTTYKPFQPVPDKILRTEEAGRITDFVPLGATNNILTADSRYKPVILFESYDEKGNVKEVRKENDYPVSYIWDYKSKYPIARVYNAKSVDVAFTSFEADGGGGWGFPGSGQTEASSPTGKKCYELGAGAGMLMYMTKVGLTPSTSYIVSYWSRNGKYTVSGEVSHKEGRTLNGWTYHEHKIQNVNQTDIGGNGLIDEVRLYPEGAQMTTFTYQPLVGMTSECDLSSKITIYEYDTYGRLKIIRDMDGKILKQNDYQYQKPVNQ